MIYIFIALKEFCVLWSAQELLDNRADEKKSLVVIAEVMFILLYRIACASG